MRQFSVGDVVTCIPDMFLRYAAPGDYKIVAAMPDRDGDHIYRIKSPLEEHERVVKESACGEHRSSSISSIGSAAALLRPPFCLR